MKNTPDPVQAPGTFKLGLSIARRGREQCREVAPRVRNRPFVAAALKGKRPSSRPYMMIPRAQTSTSTQLKAPKVRNRGSALELLRPGMHQYVAQTPCGLQAIALSKNLRRPEDPVRFCSILFHFEGAPHQLQRRAKGTRPGTNFG